MDRQSYAAVGTDGVRPVVWGVGDTSDLALAEARDQLARTDPEYRDDPIVVIEITAQQRRRIEDGEVSTERLDIRLDAGDLREFTLGGYQKP